MKTEIIVCPSPNHCRKMEVKEHSKNKDKIVFIGKDGIDGIEVGVRISDYTSEVSQESSNAFWGGSGELDYSSLSQHWGIAFFTVLLFYFSGRSIGLVLDFIKRESLH